jgi:hypothetical protein
MKPELTSLYAPPPPVRPEHCSGLEAQLLRRFDARPLPGRRWLRSRPVRRLALGTALVAGLAAASQTPVEHSVAVGHRFTITLPEGAPLPPLDTFSAVFRDSEPQAPGPQSATVALRAQRGQDQQLTLEADVWSDASPSDVEARLRALPALAGASISVATLEGQAHETLAERLGEQLFDLPADPAAIEAARERLQAALAARGDTGKVDVEVDESTPGQKRVTVKVSKETPESGAEVPAGH